MTSDAAARSAALDPRRSFIVQAPAGSGKTELLAQRYLRLLATVRSPEQILAITFTRKAAAEMRSRILHSLEAAKGPPPESAHKRSTWDLAHAVLEADARREWRLTEHPARLRIQTIDALNASLARRLPLLAGTGSALEPTDDARPLYEAAGQRLIERLGDGSLASVQLEKLIVHLGNRVDRLITMLCDLLAKRDQWLHPVVRARSSEDLRRALETTLKNVVERHLTILCEELGPERRAELFALLQHASSQLLANPDLPAARRTLLEGCNTRNLPPDAMSESLEVWRVIASMLFKQDGELYLTVTSRHGFPTSHRELKDRMLSMLRWLATRSTLCERLLELRTLPDATYTEQQWAMLESLLELLPQAVAELQLEFQSQGKADYVEVALRALRALGTADDPTDLALAFDDRIQHILVDEFQDTSFAQLDLLERLTAGWMPNDGRTLFCVGDPMQSIYRFRQADVGLFIELQQRGLRHLPLEALRLEANFRSTPSIVNWVNKVFPGVLAPVNDAEQGAVRYSPSTAALEIEGGGVTVHPDVDGDANAEATRVAGIVRDSLLEHPDGRVAILVTARTHVDAIARELTSSGIVFRAVEIEQLRDRPVVQDLIALTRALVHLGDRTAWFAVLRAPWCGMTLADLHAIAEQDTAVLLDSIRAALAAHHDDLFAPTALSHDGRIRLARAMTILEDALKERARWPLRIWVERTWNSLGGPATLTRREDLDDARAYFDRLTDIEIAGDLEDVARLEEQLQRLFASGQVHGDAQVEIMTIHAAKGLEFETVILPALHKGMRNEDRELLRWTRIAGPGGGVVLAPVKAEGSDPDPIYRWIELLERQRVLRERARLLYVAATRAKRQLHLLGSVKASTREGRAEIRDPNKGSMLQMIWSAVAPEFENAVPQDAVESASRQTPHQRIRRLPLDWAPPQLPALDAPVLNPIDIVQERPEFDWVSHTSRHVGTLVHRELERWSRSASSRVEFDPNYRARLLLVLTVLGVPADRSEAACDRVIAALDRTLADE
ncbi:MAG: UvrD-helicase domain-containing protein, partial [Povalibacter sp.]